MTGERPRRDDVVEPTDEAFTECFQRLLAAEHRCDQGGPAGLVARTESLAAVRVEILVEQYQIFPCRVVSVPRPAVGRPDAFVVASNSEIIRRSSSRATSIKVMQLPLPVGHSTLKSSP